MRKLDLYYRGGLSSCNYACPYCPFAMAGDDVETIARDRESLTRFVRWVTELGETRMRVMLTPWGEALYHLAYQEALITLSHLSHIDCVSIQTNGSCEMDWVRDAKHNKLSLWISYHPSELSLDSFLDKCAQLDRLDAHYSVGMVALNDSAKTVEQLRRRLRSDRYLWLNAHKDKGPVDDSASIDLWTRIDPFYAHNRVDHKSQGKACRAGSISLFIDGSGEIRRCHFVDEPLGNLADADWRKALTNEACPNKACGCWIGYSNLEHLKLEERFGRGLLARNPAL